MIGLRPPFLPLTLAASSPAIVLSRMMSRSNSATLAKMWKTSFPPGVVVSRLSRRETNSRPREFR